MDPQPLRPAGELPSANSLDPDRDWIKKLVDTHWPWQIVETMNDLVDRAEKAEKDRDAARAAFQRILDHGGTHNEPCWALHNGDCADVFQEIARAALAETTASSRN